MRTELMCGQYLDMLERLETEASAAGGRIRELHSIDEWIRVRGGEGAGSLCAAPFGS